MQNGAPTQLPPRATAHILRKVRFSQPFLFATTLQLVFPWPTDRAEFRWVVYSRRRPSTRHSNCHPWVRERLKFFDFLWLVACLPWSSKNSFPTTRNQPFPYTVATTRVSRKRPRARIHGESRNRGRGSLLRKSLRKGGLQGNLSLYILQLHCSAPVPPFVIGHPSCGAGEMDRLRGSLLRKCL